MAWQPIGAGEIDPESPVKTQLAGKWTDREQALYDAQIFIKKAVNENDAIGNLQNDDELFFAVGINQTWWVELGLAVTTNGAAADITLDFTVPAGATYRMSHIADGVSFTTWSAGFVVPANWPGAVTDKLVLLKGWFTTIGAAGTIQLRWAVSGAGNTTVQAGSWLHALQVYTTM